jgi:hypothetical protein
MLRSDQVGRAPLSAEMLVDVARLLIPPDSQVSSLLKGSRYWPSA